jgi:hypothetical protein
MSKHHLKDTWRYVNRSEEFLTYSEILASVGTTGLLTGTGRVHGLGSAGQQVLKLESLNKIRVPDHAAVSDTDILEGAKDLVNLLNTLIQGGLGTEDSGIVLHDLLHVQAKVGSGDGASGVAELVQVGNGLSAGIRGQGLVGGVGGQGIANVVSASTTKDDNIQERVGTETVSSVDRDTGSFTGSVQTGNNLVVSVLINGQDLSSVLGGDTTHVVMDSGQNRDGLLGDIDTRENGSGLRDTGKTLVEDRGGQVRKLEIDVILLGTYTTTLANLHGHGTGNDITGSEILGSGGITLHETLTLGVQEVSSLTAGTLSNEASGTVNTSGVELNKLQILEGETGTGNHGVTITSAGVSRGAREVGTSVSSGGEDGLVRAETVKGTILHVQSEDTTALAVLHDEIQSEVLDEEVGVVAERLSVKSVENGVTGTISDGSATVSLTT